MTLVIYDEYSHDDRAEKIIELLIRSGADPNGPRDAEGRTALHLAVEDFSLPVVEALLEGGADSNSRGR